MKFLGGESGGGKKTHCWNRGAAGSQTSAILGDEQIFNRGVTVKAKSYV